LSDIVAYRGDWEIRFTLSLEQIEKIDETIRQIEIAGYTAKRPYTPKVTEDADGIFIRYEERTDGKKGFYAIVNVAGVETKVSQYTKMLVPNLPVTIYTNDKGYKDLKVRESAPNF